jgi:SAM-dependent methyltransferase
VDRGLGRTRIFETSAGFKCANSPITDSALAVYTSSEILRVPASDLRICFDFLRDDLTSLGAPIDRGVHYDFLSRINNGQDITSCEYVKRMQSGTLDFRGPKSLYSRRRPWRGKVVLESLRAASRDALDRLSAGDASPVNVALVDGSYYVLNGKHRAAGSAVLGLDVECVLSTLYLGHEFWARVIAAVRRSPHAARYRKHLEHFDAIEVAIDSCEPPTQRSYVSIEEIVTDLEKNPIESGGNTYHPIPFPEFNHLKTSSNREAVAAKWQLILRTLQQLAGGNDLGGLRVLDIGANAGFYTFQIAQHRGSVTSIEPHPRYSPIGRYLAESTDFGVEWIDGTLRPELLDGREFDVALMLSVYQWMADGGRRRDEAAALLTKVSQSCHSLIFELGFNAGAGALRTHRLNHYGALVDLLRNNTTYRHYRLLGTTRLWRGVNRYVVLCSNDPRFEDSASRRLTRALRI